MRFAKDEVAINIVGLVNTDGLSGSSPGVQIKDAANTIHLVTIKNARFDLDGRLIGRVKGYSKKKQYIVNFGSNYDYFIKTRDCFTPHTPPFPANQPSPAVAYDMWVNGRLMRGYIHAPRRRKLGAKAYTARVDIDGKSVYGVARQDEVGKLYFVASDSCKNSHLV